MNKKEFLNNCERIIKKGFDYDFECEINNVSVCITNSDAEGSNQNGQFDVRIWKTEENDDIAWFGMN